MKKFLDAVFWTSCFVALSIMTIWEIADSVNPEKLN